MFVTPAKFSLIWLNLIYHTILRKLNMLLKYKGYAGKCEKININTFQCTLETFQNYFSFTNRK
jgi:hypothetical protein